MVSSFAACVLLTLSSASAFAPTKAARWTARKATVSNFQVTLKQGDQVNVSLRARAHTTASLLAACPSRTRDSLCTNPLEFTLSVDRVRRIHFARAPAHSTQTLEIPGDKYILDAAEEANISLPYDCRFGTCVTCGGKIESGTVDQSDQIFLTDELMDQVGVV